ncbi:MAG: sulfotransferase [Bradymonadaceae bacterium]
MSGQKAFPGFFIGGAAKSGTSSLHYILDHHPEIFLPDVDIMFFDLDEIDVHRGYFPRFDDEWIDQDLAANFDLYHEWYLDFYAEADPDQLWGEDAPSYLRSQKAPARIAECVPEAKFVFMLRDPVERIYSYYWDLYRSAEMVMDFERALRFSRPSMYAGSYYKRGLERFLAHFDREQIHIVIFQEFVDRTQVIVDEVCQFLGCEPTLDVDAVGRTHRNRSGVPPEPLIPLKLLANWARSWGPRRGTIGHLPTLEFDRLEEARKMSWKGLLGHAIGASVDRLLGLFPDADYPEMAPETRRFLEKLMARENTGLSELIGVDVAEYWPYMEQRAAERRSRKAAEQKA